MQKIGKQFIKAYYQTVTQSKNDLIKFYEQDATVWRDSFGNGEGKKVEECKEKLALDVPVGSEIAIINFAENYFKGGLHLSVFGYINQNDINSVFNQTFVLMEHSDRVFIVSDALKVSEESKVAIPSEETFVYKMPTKTEQKPKQQKQQGKAKNEDKFKAYVDKN